jgi:hypothetical protein
MLHGHLKIWLDTVYNWVSFSTIGWVFIWCKWCFSVGLQEWLQVSQHDFIIITDFGFKNAWLC